MSTYEQWSIYIGVATAAIALLGLGGLLWYVKATTAIAKATKRYVEETMAIAKATRLQGDVISRPTILVNCRVPRQPPQDPWLLGGQLPALPRLAPKEYKQPNNIIEAKVKNEGGGHAKVKMTVKVRMRVKGAEHTERLPIPSPYDGTAVWQVAIGHTIRHLIKIDKLKGKEITEDDELLLDIGIESSPWWGEEEYRPEPPIAYRWDGEAGDWEAVNYYPSSQRTT